MKIQLGSLCFLSANIKCRPIDFFTENPNDNIIVSIVYFSCGLAPNVFVICHCGSRKSFLTPLGGENRCFLKVMIWITFFFIKISPIWLKELVLKSLLVSRLSMDLLSCKSNLKHLGGEFFHSQCFGLDLFFFSSFKLVSFYSLRYI